MPDPPPVSFWDRRPILKQAIDDSRKLTWQQVGVPALAAMGNLITTLYNDYYANRLDVPGSVKTVLYSLLIGLFLYAIVAIVRAPFIVIGRQHQQLASLQQRLIGIQSLSHQPSEPHSEVNSFSDFRVISDQGLRLEFEVWYFYDGALGEGSVTIYASLENNGVPVKTVKGLLQTWRQVEVVGHRALLRTALIYNRTEGETSIKSTHIALAMEHDEKDVLFYRQLIPYEKTWNAS
jgi:hypothetical protein